MTQCEKCGRPMMFVRNVVTSKDGPIDVVSTVYVVFTTKAGDKAGATKL